MKHLHAELMLEYAKDAMETDKPWERWEYYSYYGGWVQLNQHPSWCKSDRYRRKSKPYEPTLLDQALELEIEATQLRRLHCVRNEDTFNEAVFIAKTTVLKSARNPEMQEHLKAQGKL